MVCPPYRVFETDLILTSDNSLVAAHDWSFVTAAFGLELQDGQTAQPMSEKEFKSHKIYGKYTPLSFKDIVRLMKKYPDMYLVTDTKETRSPMVDQEFQLIAEIAEKIEPDVLSRIIPQIYNEEMFYTIMDIYNWKSMIFTLYALENFSEKEVIDFTYREGIQMVTTFLGKSQELFFHGLFERGTQVYMHTINTPEEFEALKMQGVIGIYTDFLAPDMAN